MIARRDILAGVVCLAALGSAEALRPRREVRLLPQGRALRDIIPAAFPGWADAGDGEIVIPRTEGTTLSRVYDDQLARNYRAAGAAPDSLPVMLLAAYGANQNDSLQLHRPEVCYPAQGFSMSAARSVQLAVGGQTVPAVALTATFGDRIEDIVYWSRLGESLPRTEGEQRRERLAAAMHGVVGDGVLLRASTIRSAPDRPRFAEVERFLSGLAAALPREGRIALLGTRYGGAFEGPRGAENRGA